MTMISEGVAANSGPGLCLKASSGSETALKTTDWWVQKEGGKGTHGDLGCQAAHGGDPHGVAVARRPVAPADPVDNLVGIGIDSGPFAPRLHS